LPFPELRVFTRVNIMGTVLIKGDARAPVEWARGLLGWFPEFLEFLGGLAGGLVQA
jgi:hypothetical protein